MSASRSVRPMAYVQGQASRRAISISLAVAVFVWAVNGIYLSALSRYSVAAFWGADLAQWILLPALLGWNLAVRHRLFPEQYGFTPALPGWRLCAWGLIAVLTMYPAFFWVLDYAWSLLGSPGGFFALEDVFPGGVLGAVVWLYSALSAGLVESAIFIGLPWLLWTRYGLGNVFWFSFITSLVFASVHWEQGPHVIAGALAFNLVACAWYFRLKSLWPVVIGHVVVDLIAFS